MSARTARTPRPPRKGWRRIFSWKPILLTLLTFVLLGLVAFAVAWIVIDTPKPNELANAQTSIVYYADGKNELDRISEVNRISVPLSQIPVHVQRALLAAEDRTFYQNRGISISGIARAVLAAAKGGATQGGSTITQQYVKNYFLTQDQTLARKGRELIISLKIDRDESKSQILENYLNTIYYGRGAYGIQTAARAYFNKDVSALTVGEGAFLASVIRGPSLYDPALGAQQTKNAHDRVTYVLDGMASQGWLSAADRATTTFPAVLPPTTKRGRSGPSGYITAEVRQELKDMLHLSDADIDRGGLRITTTIDRNAQVAAVKAVNDNLPTDKDAADLQVGLTAIRPKDGAIVAMYGGKDYSKVQLNSATDARLQAGSTFKVFGLLAALQQGISTKTRFDGASPMDVPGFADGVRNFGNAQYGEIDLRKATASSVNTVYAQLNVMIEPQATMNASILAGIPAPCTGDQTKGCTVGLNALPSNILGTASVRVIDMANAYATIAAQGTRATPYLISRVTQEGDAPGGVDFTVQKQLAPAFDKNVAIDATDAMEQVVRNGSGSGALQLGRPAAGKTGTSTENRAVWFDGFTPQLATAVGMYLGPDGTQPMRNIAGLSELTGGSFPVRIWTDFMRGALKGQKEIDFPSRVGIGDSAVAPPTTTATPTSTGTSTAPTTSGPTRTGNPTKSTGPRTRKPGGATAAPGVGAGLPGG